MRLDNREFSRGLRQAQSETRAFGQQMLGIARSFAGPLAAAFSIRSLAVGARQGAQEIDQVAKSARAVEGSVGGIRAAELVLKESGVSAGILRQELQNLNREVSSGGAAAAMRMLGIETQEFIRLDADQKLARIADEIKALGLDAGATSSILRQFGVRNRDMALAVMAGGDAFRTARLDVEQFGLSVSAIDAARIEAANDQIARLSVVSQYLRQELALRVVPALGAFAEKITESMRDGGALRAFIDNLIGAMAGLRNALNAAGVAAAAYAGTRVPMLLTALGLKAGAFRAAAAQITLMNSQMYAGAAAAAIHARAMRTLGLAVSMAGGPFGILLGTLGAATGAMILFRDTASTAPPILREAERAIESINAVLGISSSSALPSAQRETLALTNENIRLAKSAYEAADAELAKARAAAQAAQTQLGLEQAFSPTGRYEQAEGDLSRATARLAEASRQVRDAQTGLQDRINQGQIVLEKSTEQLGTNLRTVRAELAGISGGAGASGAADVAGGVRDAMEGITIATREAADAQEEWARRLVGHFDGIITGGRKASDVLMSLARELESSMWSDLSKALSNSDGGSGKSGGGFFSSISKFFAGFFDGGGTIPRGMFGIAAERRSEFVNGVLIPGPANVTGGAQTAEILRGAGRSRIEVDLSPDLVGRILSEADQNAVQFVRAGLGEYDRRALPGSMQRVSSDPRRR
ncbi:MAG: hypothetical protein EA339_13390 [Rhodobacteraceae bacterium]|nr:MAG: hypothetical protein EA339_13390 [Paracoccaceae bacterium]